jgi:hypothetical protein
MLFHQKSSLFSRYSLVKQEKFFLKSQTALMLSLGSLLLSFNLSQCDSALAKPEQAKKAESFIDSIGVVTHLNYTDTVYYQKFNSIIKPRLQELGVRHIRDGGSPNFYNYYSRLRELRNLGIKTTLVSGDTDITPSRYLQIVKDLGNVVQDIEGPNEYNLYLKDPKWPSIVFDFMKELYLSIKKDPKTKHLKVIGPSLASWNEKDYKAVGDLSAYLDFGNLHPYYTGLHPTVQCSWCSPPKSYLDTFFDRAKIISGSKPIVVTEMGQHNAMGTNSSYMLPMPEEIAWKYNARQLLLNFNKGVHRSFLYELIDLLDDPNKKEMEYNFGLLRNNGSQKPSFMAVRDLIKLLNDRNHTAQPRKLDYRLTGNMANVHQTLLQKSNGNFYLILWQDVSSYNPSNQRAIDVSTAQVNLELKTPISQANIFALNPALQKEKAYASPLAVSLDVPDYPLIVELVVGTAKSRYKKYFPKTIKSSPRGPQRAIPSQKNRR